MRQNSRAFTLIELLVVITIIAVLLSLLAPAMDRAIYQSELVACASKLKGFGNVMPTYAAANKRFYPHRRAIDGNNAAQPSKIANSSFDDRDTIQPYLSINHNLQCPFVYQIDVDDETDGPGQHIYISYSMFHGWRFRDARASKGMRKLGDRFDWEGETFNVVASDVDGLRNGTAVQTYGSHPDLTGALTQSHAQKEPFAGFGTITLSWWGLVGSEKRPPVDFNYLFDDGEVRTIKQVLYNEWDPQAGRGLFARTPESNTTAEYPGYYTQLPIR